MPKKTISKQSPQSLTIRDLYPELSSEEQAEAEYGLNRYLDVIEQIYERLEATGNIEKELNNAYLKNEWEKRTKSH